MNGSFIRCTAAILSAASMMVVQEPSRNVQTSDVFVFCETQKSELIGVKADNVPFHVRLFSSFFDKNFNSFKDFQQDNNNNKFSTSEKENIVQISDHEFELLCDLVAAEAENQPIEGKRAVVAVVLNRMEYGPPFGDSIEEVIFQENQFSCVLDKRFFNAWEYVSEEDREAVAAELADRSDTEILYFTAYQYGKYGTPAYNIADHYFCKE